MSAPAPDRPLHALAGALAKRYASRAPWILVGAALGPSVIRKAVTSYFGVDTDPELEAMASPIWVFFGMGVGGMLELAAATLMAAARLIALIAFVGVLVAFGWVVYGKRVFAKSADLARTWFEGEEARLREMFGQRANGG